MLTSLALVFLVGFSLGSICQKIKLPRIIGMLITGIVLGPYVLDLLDSTILDISAELRQMALVIILIKAGLSLDLGDLKRVGHSAVLMSFMPALCEITGCILFAPMIFGISHIEAAIMGAVLGAVSPAVVVPRMVQLMEMKRGTKKGIPQMILGGASMDDVVVIVLFTTFVGMAQGEGANAAALLDIPVSIILGIGLGVLTGFLLSKFFEYRYKKHEMVRNSNKTIIVLGMAFLMLAVEDWLEGVVAVSGLLAVMSMALVLAMNTVPEVTQRLREKFGKLWLAAEVVLFVLVGAAVDIRYTLQAGLSALLMLAISLSFRTVGVLISLAGSKFTVKEKIFCVIAYLPKATVQAAIGSVPLAMGLPCGHLVLSMAVVSILITAPLGAIGMDATYSRLLSNDQ